MLASNGIGYFSLVELGNVFLACDDWRERYRRLLERAGDLLLDRLVEATPPFCLLCAEKRVSECHRELIAQHLVARGWPPVHIE